MEGWGRTKQGGPVGERAASGLWKWLAWFGLLEKNLRKHFIYLAQWVSARTYTDLTIVTMENLMSKQIYCVNGQDGYIPEIRTFCWDIPMVRVSVLYFTNGKVLKKGGGETRNK